MGDDEPVHLNFASQFRRTHPARLVVTLDDRWPAEKKALCDEMGAEYTALARPPRWAEFSTSALLRRARMPSVPARVDLAGGWLDVPRFARRDGYIVNCAITPFAQPDGPYRPGAGVGGSAAFAVFQGKPAVEDELQHGVGWQDPAVILETGLCVWRSGPRPRLQLKTSGKLWPAGCSS